MTGSNMGYFNAKINRHAAPDLRAGLRTTNNAKPCENKGQKRVVGTKPERRAQARKIALMSFRDPPP
jgi:hypothetical protein